MKVSLTLIAIFSLFLTACSSKPVSYLPTGSEPIINIEAEIADSIELKANDEKVEIANHTHSPINIAYKLFWYDKNGVTQLLNGMAEDSSWQKIGLEPKQKHIVILVKPTEESHNYRLYLRGNR